jgi:hypothetical protein
MRPVSHRFIALLFALLSASPFTAPFQTWALAPVQSHDASAFTSVDGGGIVEGDSAALTVPTLETRIEASSLANMDAGFPSGAKMSFLESSALVCPDEGAQLGPPRFPALRAAVLRL